MGNKSGFFYAVARGRNVGVVGSWDACKAQIHGFSGAVYKKFPTEAEALEFIDQRRQPSTDLSSSAPAADSQANCVQTASSSSDSRKRKLGVDPSTSKSTAPKKPTQAPKRKQIMDPKYWEDAKVVYTDGACSNNGQHGAKAGYGVYWGDGHKDNDYGPVHGEATNNRGELLAVQKAIETAERCNMEKVVIRTDSDLLIKSVDQYMPKWKTNGWKTSDGAAVKNQDLLTNIDRLTDRVNVKFEHVRGHRGIEGNEKADALARNGAQMYGRNDY